jgi:hypothetical protein
MATLDVLDSAAAVGDMLLPPAADGRVRFSRAAYHCMVEAGMLHCEDKVELLQGEIFWKQPVAPPCAASITRLSRFFIKALHDSLACQVRLPVAIENHSEPDATPWRPDMHDG